MQLIYPSVEQLTRLLLSTTSVDDDDDGLTLLYRLLRHDPAQWAAHFIQKDRRKTNAGGGADGSLHLLHHRSHRETKNGPLVG
jgi:hypothetical protein